MLAEQAQAEVVHHWTQMLGGSTQSFRAIVSDQDCPAITIDGVETRMHVRARPMPDFPNLVCEFATDAPVARAEMGSLHFPLRPERADQIILVGDTGCRLKEGAPVHACNDPVAWPYAKIARAIAAKEADLAIHLGDYFYREVPCPDPELCGEVFGDNWPTWEADFFVPSQPMLNAHAFVFVRGNHESCERGWLGYLRFLAADPVRAPLMCDNYQAPFVVEFEDLQLPVIDSSTRDRETYTWDRLRAMRRQFMDVLPTLDRETLLLTHTPLWGYGSKKQNSTDMETLESIQREAFAHILPRLVTAVIAGDLHFAQVVSTPGNPVQITFGNGGVWLYTTPEGQARDLPVGKGVMGDIFGYNPFGFGQIDRAQGTFTLTFFDDSGAVAGACAAPVSVDSCALD
ncbi:MAG: metallophosphoesterase [Pseudomonadota bacterium]